MEKVNLIGHTRKQLEAFLVSLGEKPFRARQLMKWIHHDNCTDFMLMTDMSKSLRAKLCDVAEITPLPVFKHNTAKDLTQKWLLDVGSKNYIETVYIPEAKRATLCVSSQVGCVLDCDFCSTGKQGFSRDLSAAEIISQIWLAQAAFPKDPNRGKRPISNVVFMGMGEPLLNTEAVLAATDIMLDDLGYGLSKRRVTISTSGVVPEIKALSKRSDVSLAVSLHAPNDELRNHLVPLNRKYPLNELISACKVYLSELPDRRRITIEYIMIDGVNDALTHAKALIRLLEGLPCKINLIPFNPFPGSPYNRSSDDSILVFQNKLIKSGITTTVRKTRGDDIDAACGQLVGKVVDRTRRQLNWQKRIQVKQLIA